MLYFAYAFYHKLKESFILVIEVRKLWGIMDKNIEYIDAQFLYEVCPKSISTLGQEKKVLYLGGYNT